MPSCSRATWSSIAPRRLSAPGERITLVNGYVPAQLNYPDYTRYDQLYLADPANIATSEYARHIAWMGREALAAQIDDFEFSADREKFASQLDRGRSAPDRRRPRNPPGRRSPHGAFRGWVVR